MKSILQPIKPQYCELIASGKKTIEVRKTRPKLDVPFKVHIYCTKSKKHFQHNRIVDSLDDLYRMPNGEIRYGYSGELMCCNEPYTSDNFLNGKVIGEYVCDKIIEYPAFQQMDAYIIPFLQQSLTCLTQEELWQYGKGKTLYGWHISDLKIYDKPKELSEFMIIDKDKLSRCPYRERIFQNPEFTNGNYLYGGYSCSKTKEPDFDDIDFCRGGCADVFKPLTRPPQSWCYVEEV